MRIAIKPAVYPVSPWRSKCLRVWDGLVVNFWREAQATRALYRAFLGWTSGAEAGPGAGGSDHELMRRWMTG